MSDPFAMARLAYSGDSMDAGILDLPPPTAPLHQQHHTDTNSRGSQDTPTRAEQFDGKLLSIPQLLALDPPEPLIGDVLFRNTLAVLFGAPSFYKTFVSLDWALCVAARLPWQAHEPGVGGWLQAAGQPVCHACDRDRGGPAGDDREHRVTAARLVLGETPAPAWAGHGTEPAARYWLGEYLAAAFRWWHETPGARPRPRGRAVRLHVGGRAAERLYRDSTPRPPKLYSRGRRHRCPACGCRGDCWLVEQVAVSTPTDSRGELSRAQRAHFRVTWTCRTCRHEDVEQRAEQLPGVPVRIATG